MNDDESAELLQYLLRCFPDINDWLRHTSPEPMATLRPWQACLSQVPFDAAEAVVKEIRDGIIPTLEPYHRYRWAIYIVDHARKKVSAAKAEQEARQRRALYHTRRLRRGVAAGSDGAAT